MTNKKKPQGVAKDKAEKATAHEQMTVSEVIGTRGVPLWIRLWLERYAAGDAVAVQPHGLDYDPATEQIARLVYDVLDTDSHVAFTEIDDEIHSKIEESDQFPHEARDFIEEWLYYITLDDAMLQPWGNPDMATIALTIALDTSAGPLNEYEKDPTLAMLRGAVRALTTKRERRAFLRDTGEEDAESMKESTENRHAAFKLARLLANPRTPAETRQELERACVEFITNAGDVAVDHPALVRRAFLLACDQRPKGRLRALKAARRELLALLDSLPEMADGKGGASCRR